DSPLYGSRDQLASEPTGTVSTWHAKSGAARPGPTEIEVHGWSCPPVEIRASGALSSTTSVMSRWTLRMPATSDDVLGMRTRSAARAMMSLTGAFHGFGSDVASGSSLCTV